MLRRHPLFQWDSYPLSKNAPEKFRGTVKSVPLSLEIARLVHDLYDLTDEEIEVVEEGSSAGS